MTAAQERAILNSTLACLVKSLINKKTTVELRNESFVTGKVLAYQGEIAGKKSNLFLLDCSLGRLHEYNNGGCSLYRRTRTQIKV